MVRISLVFAEDVQMTRTPNDFPRPRRQLASNSDTDLGGGLAELEVAVPGVAEGSKNREMGRAHLVRPRLSRAEVMGGSRRRGDEIDHTKYVHRQAL